MDDRAADRRQPGRFFDMSVQWTTVRSQRRLRHDNGCCVVYDERTSESWEISEGVSCFLDCFDAGWQPGDALPASLQAYALTPADLAAIVVELADQGLIVDVAAPLPIARPAPQSWRDRRVALWGIPVLSPNHWRILTMALTAALVASFALWWSLLPLSPGLGRLAFLGRLFLESLHAPPRSATAAIEFPLCWLLLAAVHETAHGFALTSRTGKPTAVGLRFFFGLPRPFTDASAIVTLPRRSDRLRVILAGPLAEFAAWLALLAALREHAGALGPVFLVFGPLSLCLNLVPVTQNDGYLLLQEWTGDRHLLRTARVAARLAFFGPTDRNAGRSIRWWLPWFGLFELVALPVVCVPIGTIIGAAVSWPSVGMVGGLIAGVGILAGRWGDTGTDLEDVATLHAV
jgi:hypothetical protein